MNALTKETILGEIPVDRLADVYLEFFTLASEIRTQLGGKAYLLDNYLSRLLTAVTGSYDIDASDYGMESISSLYAICRAFYHPDRETRHPFFKEGRKFIDSHPLTFQEKETQTSLYICMMANDYMKSCIEAYKQRLSIFLSGIFDELHFHDLYEKICSLLGNTEPMEKLNSLFHERFLSTSASSVFIKTLNEQLLEALSYRDPETSFQVFQLIMDHKLLEK